MESFWVDDAFFTSFTIGERPPGEPFAVRAPYTEPQLRFEEVQGWVTAGRWLQRGPRCVA